MLSSLDDKICWIIGNGGEITSMPDKNLEDEQGFEIHQLFNNLSKSTSDYKVRIDDESSNKFLKRKSASESCRNALIELGLVKYLS